MALPPFEVGAVKLTVACAFPAVAVTLVGEPGAVEQVLFVLIKIIEV